MHKKTGKEFECDSVHLGENGFVLCRFGAEVWASEEPNMTMSNLMGPDVVEEEDEDADDESDEQPVAKKRRASKAGPATAAPKHLSKGTPKCGQRKLLY